MKGMLYSNLTREIIGSAMEVHRQLGPGFLESVYAEALSIELKLRKIAFTTEETLAIWYRERQLSHTFKADFVVENKVILELKAIQQILAVHRAQVHNYLCATGLPLALLLNFGTSSLEFKRIILKSE